MFLDKNKIKDKFPFISVIIGNNNEEEYYGIILANNRNTISFIDIKKIRDTKQFSDLLQICQNWWWYSNRSIPINLYYYEDTLPFMQYVTHLPSKTNTIVSGHVASLDKIVEQNKSSIRNRILRFYD